jgi:predicted transglutaminase-like protease
MDWRKTLTDHIETIIYEYADRVSQDMVHSGLIKPKNRRNVRKKIIIELEESPSFQKKLPVVVVSRSEQQIYQWVESKVESAADRLV